MVTLHCNCREKLFLPGLEKVVPCKWAYVNSIECPDVRVDQQDRYSIQIIIVYT